MRIFDVGEFHAGFGIVALSEDETTEFSNQGVTRNGRVPFRHSLAVTLFGDSLRASMPLSPELEGVLISMLAGLVESGEGARWVIGASPTAQEAGKNKRK